MIWLAGPPYVRRAMPSVGKDLMAWARTMTSHLRDEFMTLQQFGQGPMTRTVTSAYTIALGDGLVLADATGGAFAVTLNLKVPVVIVKRTNGGGNAVTLTGTVDGTVNPSLGSQYSSYTVWSDGTSFYKIAST